MGESLEVAPSSTTFVSMAAFLSWKRLSLAAHDDGGLLERLARLHNGSAMRWPGSTAQPGTPRHRADREQVIPGEDPQA